ncbi:MAG: hypothetical protein GY929_04725 [Actinomycetia bacterium]|nr:hypothetical protein [Actinomycetes bacterium]
MRSRRPVPPTIEAGGWDSVVEVVLLELVVGGSTVVAGWAPVVEVVDGGSVVVVGADFEGVNVLVDVAADGVLVVGRLAVVVGPISVATSTPPPPRETSQAMAAAPAPAAPPNTDRRLRREGSTAPTVSAPSDYPVDPHRPLRSTVPLNRMVRPKERHG